jgi:hypothetical protein
MHSERTSTNALGGVSTSEQNDPGSYGWRGGSCSRVNTTVVLSHYSGVEVPTLEASLLEPINNLYRPGQSLQPRQEKGLTNLLVIAAQTERFGLRMGFRES